MADHEGVREAMKNRLRKHRENYSLLPKIWAGDHQAPLITTYLGTLPNVGGYLEGAFTQAHYCIQIAETYGGKYELHERNSKDLLNGFNSVFIFLAMQLKFWSTILLPFGKGKIS
jgi:hypothetical protein